MLNIGSKGRAGLNRISAWTTSYDSGARLALHARQQPYLSVVLRGSYDEHLGSRVLPGWPLRLRYHPAGEEHEHFFGRVGARCLIIEFGEAWHESLGKLEHRASAPVVIDVVDSRVIALALAAQNTLEMESAAAELLTLCEGVYRLDRAVERSAAIRKAIDYIEHSLPHSITLEDLADLVKLHPTHFARTFRAATGRTVGKFVRARRLARAQQMLAAPNEVGISRIAAACGFADHAHMTRTFRSDLGVAPSEYRKLLKS
jgi:AraC family transcriptional regulator